MSLLPLCSFFLCLLPLAACARTQPPLQVPATLSEVAERYQVDGSAGLLRHTVHFGPYTAREAKLSVQHPTLEKPTLFNGQTERVENHQTGSFVLQTPDGQPLHAECQKHHRKVTKFGQTVPLDASGQPPREDGRVVSASDTFRCLLQRPAASPMQLFIVQGSSGLVQGEGVELSFVPVDADVKQLAPTWKDSAGFLIADASRPLAAVDLTAAAQVTLRRDLTPAQLDELASVAMALLLLRDMF